MKNIILTLAIALVSQFTFAQNTKVFYEKQVENYELGKELLDRYRKKRINCIQKMS